MNFKSMEMLRYFVRKYMNWTKNEGYYYTVQLAGTEILGSS
jgi:hypothetical protein